MAHTHSAEDGHGASHSGHYVASKRWFLTVFGILVFGTLLTVFTGRADWIPSALHVPIAIAIAAFKTYFVVSHFMGLKHDNRVNTVAFVFAGIFAAIFLCFTLLDTAFRGDLGNVDTMTAQDRAALIRADSVELASYQNLSVAPGDSSVTGATAPNADDSTKTAAATAAVDSALTTGNSFRRDGSSGAAALDQQGNADQRPGAGTGQRDR